MKEPFQVSLNQTFFFFPPDKPPQGDNWKPDPRGGGPMPMPGGGPGNWNDLPPRDMPHDAGNWGGPPAPRGQQWGGNGPAGPQGGRWDQHDSPTIQRRPQHPHMDDGGTSAWGKGHNTMNGPGGGGKSILLM